MSAAWALPIAASLALAALALYRSHIAGWLGDLRVGMALAGLPRSSYTLLHDVRIPDGSGGHVRIDHLICGPAGYDVVSILALAGRLAGGSDDETWTLTRAFGRRRRVANPLAQNRRRAKAIARLVGPAPLRTLTVATRARFQGRRPHGILGAGELASRILALDADAPPFDGRAGLRAVGLAMDAGAGGRQRRVYGSAWRNPAGHALLASAACLLAFATPPQPAATTPETVVHYRPAPLAASPAGKAARNPATAAPLSAVVITSHKRHTRRHTTHHRRHKSPMQVVAMSNGMASIMEDGHLITLLPGQRSPHGWRLVRATPRYADMIDPHGRHFHFTP